MEVGNPPDHASKRFDPLGAWFVIGRLNPEKASARPHHRKPHVGWDHRAILFYRY